jgi:hypothetical protein
LEAVGFPGGAEGVDVVEEVETEVMESTGGFSKALELREGTWCRRF